VDTPPSTVTYRYDALNRIEGSTADTSAWAYDQNGTEWRNGISQVNAALLPPTPPPSGTNPQSFILTPAGETVGYRDSIGSHYFVKDNVGSVIGIFGAKGQNEDTSTSFEGSYSYSPFGELRAASSGVENNRVRFAGALADPTHPEIYTMGARIYDASLGRFLQSDPSAPGRSSYDYAVQNPVNFVDTNGLNPKTSAASGFVAAMFAIIAGAACATDSLGLCYGVSVYSAFATSALASLATWGIFRSGPVIWVEDTLILFGWALFRFIMSRLIVRIEADQRRERDSATNSARIAAVKRSLGRLADQATQANDAEKTRLKQLANAAVAEKEEALKKAAELAAQVKYTSEERDLARRELQLLREKIAALAQETHHRDDTSEATLDVAIRCTLPNGIQRTYEFSGNL
jgi:RHS repeat-associated protein